MALCTWAPQEKPGLASPTSEASTLCRAKPGETGRGQGEGKPAAKGKNGAKEAQRAQRKQEDREAEKQKRRNQLLQASASLSHLWETPARMLLERQPRNDVDSEFPLKPAQLQWDLSV